MVYEEGGYNSLLGQALKIVDKDGRNVLRDVKLVDVGSIAPEEKLGKKLQGMFSEKPEIVLVDVHRKYKLEDVVRETRQLFPNSAIVPLIDNEEENDVPKMQHYGIRSVWNKTLPGLKKEREFLDFVKKQAKKPVPREKLFGWINEEQHEAHEQINKIVEVSSVLRACNREVVEEAFYRRRDSEIKKKLYHFVKESHQQGPEIEEMRAFTGSLYDLMLRQASKPLSVGIVGMGKYGRVLAQMLNEQPYIQKIKAYSESIDGTKLKNLLEVVEKRSKIEIVRNLEEVCEGTECLALCTSSLHGKNVLAERDDRADLFEPEADKMYKYGKRIAERKYGGLVAVFTNPIGELLLLLSRLADGKMSPYQFTSPFTIDAARISRFLPEGLESRLKELCYKYAIGLHGVPEVAIPPERAQEFSDKLKYIKGAKAKALNAGRLAMIASRDLEGDYAVAQAESMSLFKDVASFVTEPRTAAYCLVNESEGGYVALPARIEYRTPLQVHPNNEYLGEIENTAYERDIQKICAEQTKRVDEFWKKNHVKAVG